MQGVNQLDMGNYYRLLKGNYRKGVHYLEAILANPTHAAEFAANLGGVSLVLGVPIGREDKNSDTLLSLLLASSVADDAVYTWLGQFYEFTSWDDLLGDAGRCQEMMADPFIWRAMASSGVAVGKSVATLAGLDCGAYADMAAVAASQTAMAAVAASQTAMTAVVASQTAMAAVAASQTAMTAVASSQTAMTAVASSQTAMTAVASSQTAMAAVIANSTALNAVAASQTAMAAVIANSTALNAVVSSSTAMTAVAASQTAMAAVAGNSTAIRAAATSATAKTAMIANNSILQSVANTWWNTMQSGFTVVRSQKDEDGVTSANATNEKYIMFAIPGGYNNGSGTTNCFHGHNGATAGSASGSYTDTTKRKILLGGGTFTETGDGMVRTWVYSI